MKRNFKRLFSLFLTAVMLLSVSPAAFAAESVPEEEPAAVETEIPDVPETPEGSETPAEPETPELPDEPEPTEPTKPEEPEEELEVQRIPEEPDKEPGEIEIQSGGIAIDAANFPDPNFRTCVAEFDTDTDGSLSDSEIADVTSIYCNDMGITDLTGLSHFTSLTSFNCSDNAALTAVDVSGCTDLIFLYVQNTKVATLNVAGKTALQYLYAYNTELAALDVSGCTALRYLDVSGCSTLTSLTLTGCTALEMLNCGSCSLSALSLPACPGLKEFYCNGNAGVAGNLDFSGYAALERISAGSCPNLTGLNVTDCTALSSLDISGTGVTGITGLQDASQLQYLFATGSALTTLNLTGKTCLKTVHVYESAALTMLNVGDCTALDTLACANCPSLSLLNITGCPSLRCLECISDSNMTALDVRGAALLLDAVKNGTKSDYGSGFKYEKGDVSLTVPGTTELITEAPSQVDLNAANFPDAIFRGYVGTFDTDSSGGLSYLELAAVTNMDCSGLGIGDLTGLGCFTSLQTLDCSDNALTSLDFTGLTSLTVLDCSGNNLTRLDLSPAAGLLPAMEAEPVTADGKDTYSASGASVTVDAGLTVLPGTVPITAEYFPDAALRAWISANTDSNGDGRLTVTELNAVTKIELANWPTGSAEVRNLAGLENFPALETLTAYFLPITAVTIPSMPGLKKLEFIDCENITNADVSGCPALTKLVISGSADLLSLDLQGNPMLQTIDISSSGLTALSVSHLSQLKTFVCSWCPNLQNLNLSGMELTTLRCEECPELKSLTVNNTHLKNISCNGCPKLTSLSANDNYYLEGLDCANCALTELKLRGTGSSLKALVCSGNRIATLELGSFYGLERLWCQNNCLVELNLGACEKLNDLKCNGNPLAALDLTNSPLMDQTYHYPDETVTGTDEYDVPYRQYYKQIDDEDCFLCIDPDENVLVPVDISAPWFPDPNFQSFVWMNFDTDKDGTLSVAELGAVSGIDITDQAISDLTGVQYFYRLRSLSCGYNNLTSLDLSGMSNLRYLHADHNSGLASLDLSGCVNLEDLFLNSCALAAAPDLSGCVRLRRLDISYNAGLSTLSLGEAVGSLQILYMNDTAVKALDLSGCAALRTVYADECPMLSAVNLTGCSALETLHAYNAPLTTLDLTGCTAMKALALEGTALTSLNCSGLTALDSLNCQDCPNLQSLNCSGCVALDTLSAGNLYNAAESYAFTSLDLTGCTALRELHLNNTAIPGVLDLRTHPALWNLSLGNNRELTGISAADLTTLYTADLGGSVNRPNPKLESADFSGCTSLRDVYCKSAETCGLKNLTLTGCTALEYLWLDSCRQLEALDLSGLRSLRSFNCLGEDAEYGSLASLTLTGCTALESCFVRYNVLTDLDFSDCSALVRLDCQFNTPLESLNLSGCAALQTVYANDCPTLSAVNLAGCSALEELYLYGDAVLTALNISSCASLAYLNVSDCTALTALDVSANRALYWLRMKSTGVTSLDLSRTPILRNLVLNVTPDPWYGYDVYSNGHDLLEVGNTVTITKNPSGTINAANFPDDAFRTYVAVHLDVNSDGFLSEAECSAVTEINCSGLNIASLKGIDFFPSLKKLNCSMNPRLSALEPDGNPLLEELDCTGCAIEILRLRDLPSLRWADCSGNGALTNLVVENCPALEELNCSECPGLTALELTGLANLKTLRCRSCSLTSLLLNLPALEVLECQGNDLILLSIALSPMLAEAADTGVESTSGGVTTWTLGDRMLKADAGIRLRTGVVPLTVSGFPDDHFRAVMGNYDLNSDGALDEVELSKITELSFAGAGVTTLEGIEHLSYLTQLDCHSNPLLTSLDLRANTALRYLDCSRSGLTSLEVTGLTKLETLICYQNADLSALDLSDCTGLKTLDCYETGLTALNLANFTDLEELRCYSCALSSLQVSGCAALRLLLCNDNPGLAVLNLTGCAALEELNCGYAALTSLDLSGCPALTQLSCNSNPGLAALNLTGCAALEALLCDTTALTSLDLRDCAALKQLYCGGLDYTTPSPLAELDLSGCRALEELTCRSCAITSLDLSHNPTLRTVYCDDCENLSTLKLTGCAALEELSCASCSLTALSVSGSPALRYLNCPSNEIAALDLRSNPALEELNCSDNYLATLDLSRNLALSILSCGNNGIKTLDLSGHASLTRLVCSGGELESLALAGCAALYDADISVQWQLRAVDLRPCPLLADAVFNGVAIPNYNSVHYESSLGNLLACRATALRTDDGYCGSFCEGRGVWSLSNDGVLTLGPSGLDPAGNAQIGVPYDDISTPWNVAADTIRSIQILEGVTEIGSQAFTECVNLEFIEIAESVAVIAPDAFPEGISPRVSCVTGSPAAAYADAHGWIRDFLLVIAEGPGSVTRDKEIYSVGDSAKLWAEPAEGALFLGWFDKAGTALGTGMSLSLPAMMSPTTVRAVFAAPPESLVLDADYLLMKIGEERQLNPVGLPASLKSGLSYETMYGRVTASNGLVKAVSPGIDYVTATLTVGGRTWSARCRVDVVDESGEPLNAQLNMNGVRLTDTKATVELYRTDYTRVTVVPVLTQNLSPASVGDVIGHGDPTPRGGVAIDSACFKDEAVAKLFALRVYDDRSLEIIPTDAALTLGQSKPGQIKGSYKNAAVCVVIDGLTYDAGTLTLTVKKSLPTVKVQAVKLNSFFEDRSTLVFPNTNVTAVALASGASVPDWLRFDSVSRSVSYRGEQNAKKSAKLSLSVTVDGWAIRKTVTVSVSAAKSAPKLSFRPASLTLKPGTNDSASTTVTVSPATFANSTRFPVALLKITEGSGKTMKTYGLGDSVLNCAYSDGVLTVRPGSLLTAAGNPLNDGKAHTFKVWLEIGGQQFAVTVKTLPEKTAVTLTLKAAGAIDLGMEKSPVTITAATKNFNPANASYSVTGIVNAKTKEDAEGKFQIEKTGGNTFQLTAGSGLEKGSYTVTMQADCGGVTAEKTVNITVKQTANVKQSASVKVTGNIDVLRPGTTAITIRPTVKNCYNIVYPDIGIYVRDGKNWIPLDREGQNYKLDGKIAFYTDNYLDGTDVYAILHSGEKLDHTRKYAVKVKYHTGTLNCETGYVALSVKQGSAKFTQSTKTLTMLKDDVYSTAVLSVTPTDSALKIREIRLDPKVKSSTLFSCDSNGEQVRLGYAGGIIPAKAQTVKLQVFLEGNATEKPNATISVKVNIK